MPPAAPYSAPVIIPAPTRVADPLLERLAVAETAAERCALLGRLEPGEDPRIADAISDVLERSQLASVRLCATQALGTQRSPVALSWLVSLTDDAEPEVHTAALEVLAASDDAHAQAAVVEATHDDNPEVRASALGALLKAGREQAFAALPAVLPSVEDRTTLESLIAALGQSHDARALPVLDSLIATADRESHDSALSALLGLELPGVAERLSRFLDVGSQQEFELAAGGLSSLAPAALTLKLRGMLRSGNAERRRLALGQLLNLNLPDRAELMADMLRSGDSAAKSLVVQDLSAKPDPAFEPQLIALAESDEPSLSSDASFALARLDTPSARAALARPGNKLGHKLGKFQFLKEPEGTEAEVRAQLIARLEGESPEAAMALHRLVNDASPVAQEAAFRYVQTHQDARSSGNFFMLATSDSVRKLVDSAPRFDREQRLVMVQGLARRGDLQFSGVLREALHDQDPDTRSAALRGLVELGDQVGDSELPRWIRSSEANERALAAELLATNRSPDAGAQLQALAQDSDPQVVSNALHSLQRLAPELVAQLAERAFRAAGPEHRATLLTSLSDLGSSVTRPLDDLALADVDDATAIQGVHDLTNLAGPASAERLLQLVNDSQRSQQVRQEAASALQQLGGPLARANRALLEALSPSEVFGTPSCDLNY